MSSSRKPFDKTLIKSFGYAFKGIATLMRSERNAWIHVAVTIAVIAAGIILGLTRGEWIAVSIAIAMVLAGEAFNSAVEKVCDHATTECHPLIGDAKDLAAAGVLITAVGAVAVGLIIFVPKIWALL